jgi:hypothetical protein
MFSPSATALLASFALAAPVYGRMPLIEEHDEEKPLS